MQTSVAAQRRLNSSRKRLTPSTVGRGVLWGGDGAAGVGRRFGGALAPGSVGVETGVSAGGRCAVFTGGVVLTSGRP